MTKSFFASIAVLAIVVLSLYLEFESGSIVADSHVLGARVEVQLGEHGKVSLLLDDRRVMVAGFYKLSVQGESDGEHFKRGKGP